jgi:hypothetical protein
MGPASFGRTSSLSVKTVEVTDYDAFSTFVDVRKIAGLQDHTTSPYASVALVCRNFRVHRIPVPTFVTMADAPLSGTGWLLM